MVWVAGKDETYAVTSDLALRWLSSQWKSKAVPKRLTRWIINSTGSELTHGSCWWKRCICGSVPHFAPGLIPAPRFVEYGPSDQIKQFSAGEEPSLCMQCKRNKLRSSVQEKWFRSSISLCGNLCEILWEWTKTKSNLYVIQFYCTMITTLITQSLPVREDIDRSNP